MAITCWERCYSGQKAEGKKVWGVTIDDSRYEEMSAEEVVSSLRSFRVRFTVRIVTPKDRELREYISLFQKIHQAADIMAEPVVFYVSARIGLYTEKYPLFSVSVTHNSETLFSEISSLCGNHFHRNHNDRLLLNK
ncbi:MAG: hypothetical protein Q4A78_01045 [Peptostreptococcaceae bacterium]|nr:hypothetical protein [Peptostreptococcaceae bacterium]